MSGRYRVNSLDCSADGMERLRYQSESILLAYIGSADATAAALIEELKLDLQTCERDSFFDYDGAREALDSWYLDGGESMLQAEIREASQSAESGDLNWNDESAYEFDSVSVRIYLDDLAPESDSLVRLSACADCYQAAANGLDSIELSDSDLAAVAAGLERETASGATLAAEHAQGFSWTPCELCRRPEGGERHSIAVVEVTSN